MGHPTSHIAVLALRAAPLASRRARGAFKKHGIGWYRTVYVIRQQCRVDRGRYTYDCRVDSRHRLHSTPRHPAPPRTWQRAVHVCEGPTARCTEQRGCIGLGACASAELQGGVAFIHRTGATKAHSPRHAIVQVLHPVSVMYDFGTYLREVCRQHGYRGERAVRYFCRGRGYQLGQKSGRAYGGSK